ncbi:MAG: DUF4238 domain-containing protein [Sphingomonadales bacterium]
MTVLQLENQHYVPKFLLRNFVDSDGKAFSFGIQNDEHKKRPPKQIAGRANFNELMVGGHPTSFEDRFESLETAAAPVVKKIIQAVALTGISENERLALARFIISQSFRTDAYRTGLAMNGQSISIGDHLAGMWGSIEPLSKYLLARRWALMVIEDNSVFYLGDNPVVLQSTEHPGKAMELGFDVAGTEVFMPLSPKQALYLPCSTIAAEILNGYKYAANIMMSSAFSAPFSGFPITATQEQQVVADRVLESAGPLYRALTLGCPLKADEGNVENLNYLQCAWASHEIFSNKSDFSFAERAFCENPQYRNVLTVRQILVA